MNSPLAFEYRRKELQSRDLPSSDADVVDSYLDMMSPQGLLTQYLQCGSIALVLGDVLFLHGGLHEYNMGYAAYWSY